MANRCSNSKRIRGLFVHVISSIDGKSAVSSIGSRTDVKHFVTVENLGGYPADLNCRGQISSTHPSIRFDSPEPGDSATAWRDSYPGLLDNDSHPFDHVKLLPTSSGGRGSEIIHTNLDVVWPQPARKSPPVALAIQVSP